MMMVTIMKKTKNLKTRVGIFQVGIFWVGVFRVEIFLIPYRGMPNFNFSEKGLRLVSPPYLCVLFLNKNVSHVTFY